MRFSIQKEILEKFPDLKIGLILVKCIDNSLSLPQIRDKFQMTQEDLQKKYSKFITKINNYVP